MRRVNILIGYWTLLVIGPYWLLDLIGYWTLLVIGPYWLLDWLLTDFLWLDVLKFR